MRLLVIEDDEHLGLAVSTCLRQDGYAVDWERDGAIADDILRYQTYDVIVVDIGLPGLDGISILKALRARGDKTPVLVLTARSAVDDRIDALDLGADDYLAKPFDVREFLARCRALPVLAIPQNYLICLQAGRCRRRGSQKSVQALALQVKGCSGFRHLI